MIAFEACGLVKTYGGRRALDGFTLRVAAGAVVAASAAARLAMVSMSSVMSSRAASNSASQDALASRCVSSLRWAGRSTPASSARRSRGSPAANLPLVSETT